MSGHVETPCYCAQNGISAIALRASHERLRRALDEAIVILGEYHGENRRNCPKCIAVDNARAALSAARLRTAGEGK